MRRVVEMLSASLRMVATSSTVGKAENSSGFWIQRPTIRIKTESAIDSARPKSMANAGTGRKNRQRMRMMPTAKATSLPPRLAGAEGIAVTDISDARSGATRIRRRGAESGRRSLREGRRPGRGGRWRAFVGARPRSVRDGPVGDVLADGERGRGCRCYGDGSARLGGSDVKG